MHLVCIVLARGDHRSDSFSNRLATVAPIQVAWHRCWRRIAVSESGRIVSSSVAEHAVSSLVDLVHTNEPCPLGALKPASLAADRSPVMVRVYSHAKRSEGADLSAAGVAPSVWRG